MKQPARDIQYIIRGVPSDVDRALRGRARTRKQSLNQLIIDELTAVTLGSRKRADFSDVTGKWTSDSAFDEIVAAQRQIDLNKWT